MANIILPAVPVLNEIDDSTKLLIEQAGEINRYPISDLDIGGGDVTIDLNSPGGDSTNIGNPINADTLGGKPASDYVLKDELILDGVGGGGEGDITIEIDPSAKEKPQSPLYSTSNDTHFYPLTTADQVILDDGNRLDDEISKYLTVELEGEAAEPNGINADTLGGYPADEFAKLSDLENISAGMTMELLWENASPTSEFGAQTISINLSNYSHVYIKTRFSTDIAYAALKKYSLFLKCDTSILAHYNDTHDGSANMYNATRSINILDTGIEFSDAHLRKVNTTEVTTPTVDNSNCIPLEIYGIKGVFA